MKTPRLTDFDPNAKAPTLKSSLDNMPIIEKPQPPQEVKSSTPPLMNKQEDHDDKTVRPYESTPVREYARPPSEPKRRRLIRYPFEFFEDQVEDLRQLSLQGKLRGEKTSMSEMAREAFDNYLKHKKNRTPVR